MFAENSRGLLVQHDPSVLMGLGVLLEPLAVLAFPDRPLDDDDAVVELEVVPVERAEFATTCACRHGGPDEYTPVRSSGPRLVHELGCLLGSWWSRLGCRHGRLPSHVCRVDADPAPPHSSVEGTAQYPVDRANP